MKTVMSESGVPFLSKIKSFISLFDAHKNKGFSDAKRVIMHHQRLSGYLDKHTDVPLENARILDIGCGQVARQVALFHADGADVIGIDLDVPTYKMNLSIFLNIIKTNGIERALKSFARHFLFDKKFFKDLSKEYGKDVSFDNIDTRVMDATSTTFESNSFDFIFSNVVFQHIDNVEGAVKEVNRLLKPGGISAISLHLFPSISGGICHEWLNPEESPSSKVPPWDHLRENQFPANIHLNKMTLNQYYDIFRSNLNVVDEITTTEGKQFLTTEIESELKEKGYSLEDLLTRMIIFISQKKCKHC